MIKVFFAIILIALVTPVELTFAQGAPRGIKIYSGYLQLGDTSKGAFWRSLFGVKSPKPEEVDHDRQCTIEFQSPVSFSSQSVDIIPEQLAYFIRFKNEPRFSKFIIKIYTNNDEEYTIDPDSEGKQVGINDEHHILDSYLIYLILGTGINHLEIVSPSGNGQDKYVLDKLEIQDNH
jgi:hypothetical protein